MKTREWMMSLQPVDRLALIGLSETSWRGENNGRLGQGSDRAAAGQSDLSKPSSGETTALPGIRDGTECTWPARQATGPKQTAGSKRTDRLKESIGQERQSRPDWLIRCLDVDQPGSSGMGPMRDEMKLHFGEICLISEIAHGLPRHSRSRRNRNRNRNWNRSQRPGTATHFGQPPRVAEHNQGRSWETQPDRGAAEGCISSQTGSYNIRSGDTLHLHLQHLRRACSPIVTTNTNNRGPNCPNGAWRQKAQSRAVTARERSGREEDRGSQPSLADARRVSWWGRERENETKKRRE